MIIKVLPNKIPKIWDSIKLAATKSSGVTSNIDVYLNDLLHSLLSSKSQCFVRLDESQKEIEAIIITRIMVDGITAEKYLLLQTYYAFKAGSNENWIENMQTALDFAKKENCSYISCMTHNQKIIELAAIHGFKEKHRTLEYKLKG